jgi:hypothetical protein
VKKKRIVGNKKPKNTLRLPDLDQAKTSILNGLPSKESQRGYRHAIEEFIAWYCSEPRLSFNRIVVTRYRNHLESRHLAPGTINGRLAAVRRLAYEAADSGLLSPELAAGIRRVKGAKYLGVRLGNWLTAEQARLCGRCPIAPRSRANEIERCSRSCWVAGCAAEKPQSLILPTSRDARTTGRLLIWSGKAATFVLCLSRNGSRPRLTHGWLPPKYLMAACSGASAVREKPGVTA